MCHVTINGAGSSIATQAMLLARLDQLVHELSAPRRQTLQAREGCAALWVHTADGISSMI
jgi:hypothetical protein